MNTSLPTDYLVALSLLRPLHRINGINLVLLFLVIIVGGITGVLINYFADVLPSSRRLSQPLCTVCNQPYTIKDYLVTYRCSNCGNKKSTRAFIVLVGAIIVSILLKYFPLSNLGFWGSLPILIFLGVILVIDSEQRLVLFETSLFGLALFLIYGVILRGFLTTMAGGLAGFLLMLGFYVFGIVFSKIIGRLKGQNITEVAFGFGDVCAGTFLGLLTGWPLIAGAIIIAMLAFGVFSIVFLFGLLVLKRYRAFANALPFAPFLILGTIVIFYL